VFMARDRHGRRVVQSVREITGSDGTQVTTNEIWAPGPDGRAERTAVSFTESTRAAIRQVGYREGWA
jgi:pilus assembly protein CpaF